VAVALWNGSAFDALTNTETDHILTLTEVADDIQEAA
jgi:hypothetical protein